MSTSAHPKANKPSTSPQSERKGEVRPVRIASDEAVDKAIKRATRDHRELVKALAK